MPNFTIQPAGLIFIASLDGEWMNPKCQEPPLLSLAAITDEPPPEVAAARHDRMIINI